MPKWLQKQIKQAFINKDTKQIALLNRCWYYYRQTNTIEEG